MVVVNQNIHVRCNRMFDCSNCQAKPLLDLSILDDNGASLTNNSKKALILNSGEMIFHEGDPCRGVYCIGEGVVAVRKNDRDGNRHMMRLATAGQFLGYRAFLAGEVHATETEVVEDARLCFIHGDVLSRLLKTNPVVSLCFGRSLARDLRETEELCIRIASLSARRRLVHLLMTMKETFATSEAEESISIRLPLSRQDMATMIGVRPETISRTIRQMQNDDVAHFTGRRVRVPSLRNLLVEMSPSVLS